MCMLTSLLKSSLAEAEQYYKQIKVSVHAIWFNSTRIRKVTNDQPVGSVKFLESKECQEN